MYLVIAEKPSVSKAIAEVIGASKKEEGYLEGKGCIVSWCFEERDLIKKIQRFRLPAQPLQGGRHAGVCK